MANSDLVFADCFPCALPGVLVLEPVSSGTVYVENVVMAIIQTIFKGQSDISESVDLENKKKK